MIKKYDVVVVGAGPAGLLAALAAGQAGCRVALLERKNDICRLERMCGQTLVSLNDYYFGDLICFNEQGRRIAFPNSGFSVPYTGPVKYLYAWHIFSPDGSRLPFGLPEDTRPRGDRAAVGIAYDKEMLFACLESEVRAAGVDIHTGVDVTRVATAGDSVRFGSREGEYEGLCGIAADGTNSRIARLLGIQKERTLYSYLLSSGWYMRGLALPDDDILLSSICFEGPAPGYMFIFPRPHAGQHTVVFLSLDPRVDLADVADYFMRRNPFFAAWFLKAEKLHNLASAQYVYSPVAVPYRGRLLLAGDTGACQELENSGAMISGWKAGCAAAAAVRECAAGIAPRAYDEYVAWWKSVYLEGCRHEDYIMNFALPYVLDDPADFNYLCRLVREPLPPCWNPYAAIGHMGALMQRLMPVIQKERPAMAAKLAGMARPMSEVLASTTAACQPVGELE